MESLAAYIPADRCRAILRGDTLPEHDTGAVLFADISGFTPLTDSLLQELGPLRGAEMLTHYLNLIYDALIGEVDAYGGSVMGFAGDAITCWLPGDNGLCAAACGLAMQQAMAQFAAITTPSGKTIALAMKAAVATGPVRRFLVGDPAIQLIDVLAGTTLDRMATAEKHASKGEVILGPETVAALRKQIHIASWRIDTSNGARFAVVSHIHDSPAGSLAAAQAAPDARASLTAEQARPWLLPPVYERLHAGQGQFLAEIRPAVALFLRFRGIDYDNDEEAGSKLDTFIRWVQRTLARYEGGLLQVTMGDKGSYLYAAFGAPLAHDDDPDRAVAAALDLIMPPPMCSFIQAIHIGISQGRMRAGSYGGTTRRTYGVLGDSVNLAARLMSNAQPGHILVSQRIADAVASRYQLRALGQIQVKGKPEPVAVSLVQGRKHVGPFRLTALHKTPLVGREAELARLAALLKHVSAGAGQIVRLEGVTGIGKSHLAAALGALAQLDGMNVVSGVCQSTNEQIAYTPWREIIRTLLGFERISVVSGGDERSFKKSQIEYVTATIRQFNPDWLLRLPLLGELLDLPIPDNATTASFDPRLRQEALHTLIIELIQTYARQQPLLLLLEDVHWMDEASRILTLALCRVLAQVPIMVCIVHRPPVQEHQPILPLGQDLTYHHHIIVHELNTYGITALVSNQLGGVPSALVMSIIQHRAQGNPFFSEELVEALREAETLYQRDDGIWDVQPATFQKLRAARCLLQDPVSGAWTLDPDTTTASSDVLGLPDTIHTLVLSRMDRLPETHKLTLKVASVIGRIFRLDVLAQAHPLRSSRETLLEQLHLFEHRDFARLEVPPPRAVYMFKHNITQEVTYTTLLEAQQRDLHRAVGEVLEGLQPEAVETLAYHYSRSGVRDKTLFYLDKAARKSRYDYASETALYYYDQALALEERWQWRYGKTCIFHILGQREEQAAAIQALAAAPQAPAWAVNYLQGQYYEAIGEYIQAQEALDRALLAYQEAHNQAGVGHCLAQQGQIARRQGDYESAFAWYTRALRLLEQIQPRTVEAARVLVEALNGLGTVHLRQSRFQEANDCYEQALHVSRDIDNREGEALALSNLGTRAYYQRLFAAALGYYHQSLKLRRTIGDRAGEGTSLFNLSIIYRDMGNYGQALEQLSAVLTIQQAVGNRWGEVNAWNDLGILYQELGELLRAQECLQHALTLSREIGDEAGQAYVLANLGLVARDLGDLAGAQQLLSDGLLLAQAQDDKDLAAWFQSYLASVYLLQENYPRAVELAHASLAAHRALDLEINTTTALATLAAACLAQGQLVQALEHARTTVALLDACGGEGAELPQQDYFICYKVLQAAGDTQAAYAALQAAYDLVMNRATTIDDDQLRHSFLDHIPIHRELLAIWADYSTTADA